MYVYCAWQVLGIDEDNARVMVSLAVGGSAATVSQYAIKLVTKAEFDKFSKYLSKVAHAFHHLHTKKGKGSLYSITECRVPELIPVLGSQPAGDVSHKSGSRLRITFRQARSYPRNP